MPVPQSAVGQYVWDGTAGGGNSSSPSRNGSAPSSRYAQPSVQTGSYLPWLDMEEKVMDDRTLRPGMIIRAPLHEEDGRDGSTVTDLSTLSGQSFISDRTNVSEADNVCHGRKMDISIPRSATSSWVLSLTSTIWRRLCSE